MRSLLPLILFAGCAQDPQSAPDFFAAGEEPVEAYDVDPLPVDANAPPPVVSSVGSCGGVMTFTITGNTPFGQVRLARSPNLGGVPGPGPCLGFTQMRIGPPINYGPPLWADMFGNVSFTTMVPPAACGWHVQPLDVSSCTTGMWLTL